MNGAFATRNLRCRSCLRTRYFNIEPACAQVIPVGVYLTISKSIDVDPHFWGSGTFSCLALSLAVLTTRSFNEAPYPCHRVTLLASIAMAASDPV
jgi:hypothetical protein